MDIFSSCKFMNGSYKPVLYTSTCRNLLMNSRKKNNVGCCRAATKFVNDKETKNLYKVLSLNAENAGTDEIRKAYRTMALRYHPDVCHPSRKEEFTRMFVELRKAYEVLSDPVSRKKYDSELLSVNNKFERKKDRWEEQLCELRRRSESRMEKKGVYNWRN